MSSNWIAHTVSTTPLPITSDDLTTVSQSRIDDYYHKVHAHLFYGIDKVGGTLPAEIQERLSGCAPQDVSAVLERAIVVGSVMDSGWLEDYFRVTEVTSLLMDGYPKGCLGQWRKLRDAAAGRKEVESTAGRRGENRSNSSVKRDSNVTEKPFRLLGLPEEIREKVYRLVLGFDSLTVSDWSVGSVPSALVRRTEYDVPFPDTSNTRRTTYIILTSNPRLGTELNLLLANRQIHREAAKVLYDCELRFRGTAASTLAFLHDHSRKLALMTKMSLRFTTGAKVPFLGCATATVSRPPPTPKSNVEVWGKIFDMIVRGAAGLQDLELVLDKQFWERAPWQEGPHAVLDAAVLCQPGMSRKDPGVRNFLQDVARLSGVNFRLAIAGAESEQARRDFRKELEARMCERMRKRPYLAVGNTACVCRKRLLNEACAWERDNKRCRT
ncbi:hypothetical protein K432DRAFT_402428 [Lepidopterella palustris CBS 459.81]|uniref:DUF7730 domain-containing protein n=1 Tax=Lepidopterella palustris CBS 459.81 TaxID=1314670 RepID=A0A8E2JHN7_9PEZI|nr:hypothetical protein K432DRAFT_402428 [Lepidopterella palustris CBS 459.81]